MSAPIELSPGVSYGGPKPAAFEAVLDYIDDNPEQPFSEPSLARIGGYMAARYVIRAYLALGLIERLSRRHARPVYYRVAAHAMPAERAA